MSQERRDGKISRRTFLTHAATAAVSVAAGVLLNETYRSGTSQPAQSVETVVLPGPQKVEPIQAAPSPVVRPTLVSVNGLPVVDFKALYGEPSPHKEWMQRTLGEIISHSPDTSEANGKPFSTRLQLETEFFQALENNLHKNLTASEVLLGLSACATIPGRMWGMELLWIMRQEGKLSKFGIHPLEDNKIKWAKETVVTPEDPHYGAYRIDPRQLAIAQETMLPAIQLLQAGAHHFLEAVPAGERLVRVSDRIPNAGLLAALQSSETGKMGPYGISDRRSQTNVGSRRAWTELNLAQGQYPSGHEDLEWLAEKYEGYTGLPFIKNVKLIPGSENPYAVPRADEDYNNWFKTTEPNDYLARRIYRSFHPINGGGGAIGPQFMPINARVFTRFYEEANKTLGNTLPNPMIFDPYVSSLMMTLYIAGEWYSRDGHADNPPTLSLIKGGYHIGDQSNIERAIASWNQDSSQINYIVSAGRNYFSSFPDARRGL